MNSAQHTQGPSLDHRCQDEPCCYFGQCSPRDCGCHRTREQVAEEIIAELVEALEYAQTYLPDSDIIADALAKARGDA